MGDSECVYVVTGLCHSMGEGVWVWGCICECECVCVCLLV